MGGSGYRMLPTLIGLTPSNMRPSMDFAMKRDPLVLK